MKFGRELQDIKQLIHITTISLKEHMYSSMHELTIPKDFDIKCQSPLNPALSKLIEIAHNFIGLNVT